jgi:hypothetical protein
VVTTVARATDLRLASSRPHDRRLRDHSVHCCRRSTFRRMSSYSRRHRADRLLLIYSPGLGQSFNIMAQAKLDRGPYRSFVILFSIQAVMLQDYLAQPVVGR